MKLKCYAVCIFVYLCSFFSISSIFSQACTSATLVGGTATTNNITICTGYYSNLFVNGSTTGTGLTYQWEISPDSSTWTAIAGATQPNYYPLASNAFYRRQIICSSGGAAYSSGVRQSIRSFLGCYCTPSTQCNAVYRITNVSCGTLNNSSTCATNGYTNYGGLLPPPDLQQGTYVPISVTVGAGVSSRPVDCYVDYDHNSTFDPSEQVSLTNLSGNVYSGFVKVAYHALTGITMMRVVYSSAPSTYMCSPVGSYTETEDYYVNITANTTTTANGFAIYVKPTTAAGDSSGRSWADALTSVTKALQMAATGDTIKVAAGTYYTGTNSPNGYVLKDSITLLGGYPATGNPTNADRNFVANATILSAYKASGNTAAAYHVLYASGPMPACVADGFILQNGGNYNGDPYETPTRKGGGLYAQNGANFILRNCIFRNNSPEVSGTAMCINQSSPQFYNCIITGNTNAFVDYGPSYTSIVLIEKNSSPVFYNLLMTGNNAKTLLHADSSAPVFKNSTIVKNFLQKSIITGANLSNLTFQNSILFYNTTYNNSYQSVIADTADIKLTNANATLANCITQMYGQGTNLLIGYQPKFRDTSSATGPDGVYFTADDGLALNNPCSPGINTGANALAAGIATDLTGRPRLMDNTVDMGAYETQQAYTAIPSVVYVRAGATGQNNGSSWADAFTDLHKALQTCSDTIKIATGTYAPFLTSNQPYWLENKRIIWGSYPAIGNPTNSDRNYTLYPTTITGATNTSTPAETVIRGQQLDSTSVLDGITFTGVGVSAPVFTSQGVINYFNCNNPVLSNCAFTANYGSVFVGRNNTNPQLSNCRFFNNFFVSNGSLAGILVLQNSRRTRLTNCVFENNTQNALYIVYNDRSPVVMDSCTFVRNGGTVVNNQYSNSTFTACNFINNTALDFYSTNSSPVFTRCMFRDSLLYFQSYPLTQHYLSAPVYTDCQFYNGVGAANNDSSLAQYSRCIFSNCGGGLVNRRNSNIVLSNCIATGCLYASQYSGGSFMSNFSSSPVMNNCIVVNGKSTAAGVISNDASSYLQVNNTVFWKNYLDAGLFASPRADIVDQVTPGHTVARNSTFEFFDGGAANNNTKGVDPRFVNVYNPVGPDGTWFTADDGLQLCNCSPAINTGNTTYIAGTTDIADQPRVFGNAIDRGAYELQSVPPANVPTAYYVDAAATGANTGESWGNAYNSFYTALSNACADTVRMAAGIYKPAVQNRDSMFTVSRSLAIIGSYNPANPSAVRDVDANPTIFSGDIGNLNDISDNSRGLLSISNADSILMDGIVLKGTNDNATQGTYRSALISSYVSRFDIVNSRLYHNITANGKGGAIFLSGIKQIRLEKTVIKNNNAYNAGGMFIEGYGPTNILNCIFDSNYAANYGGGLYISSGSQVNITNSLFNANTGMYWGGGLYNEASPLTITNCTFHNNRLATVGNITNRPRFGAGIWTNQGFQAVVINSSIFTNNSYLTQPGQQTAFLDMAKYGFNNSSPNAGANDLTCYNNAKTTPSNYGGINYLPDGIRYKDTTNPIGPDNRWFTADDGLQLAICSDGIDKGRIGVNNTPSDLAGRPRIFNTIVDLGAYEFSGTPETAKLLTTANDSLIANKEITDASGWTHYYKDCYYLMSVQKRGQNIGSIGDGTFSVKIKTTPAYGSGGATDLSNANYISPGVNWKVMNRTWAITPTSLPIAYRYDSLIPLPISAMYKALILQLLPNSSFFFTK